MLQQGVRFHPRCKEGVDALRQYHYEYDEEKKDFSPRPAHDWASHTADAMRGVACVAKVSNLLSPKGEKPAEPEPVAKPMNYHFKLQELFEEHSRAVASRRRI